MIPVVYNSRTNVTGGLWTPKLAGSFDEGDASQTRFFIEGRVEIKELSGHLKLFCKDVRITDRRFIISDEERKAILEEEASKLFQEQKEIQEAKGLVYELEDESEGIKKKRYEDAENKTSAIISARRAIFYPKLNMFLSKKRPKKRMTDIHKTGAKVYIHQNTDGVFGDKDNLGDFEATLKDIPDVLEYAGLVVIKLPADEPKTEEPVLYGMVKFQSAKAIKIKTLQSLQLTKVIDDLSRVVTTDPTEGGGKGKGKKAAGGGGKRNASDFIKHHGYYTALANNGWMAFNKHQDDLIDFPTFLKMIDVLNIFMVDTQAKRIFDAVDLAKAGQIGMLEFENFLMCSDVLGSEADLVILDIYDSFKVEPSEDFKEFFGNKQGLDFSGFCEACQLLEATKSAIQKAQDLEAEKKKVIAMQKAAKKAERAKGIKDIDGVTETEKTTPAASLKAKEPMPLSEEEEAIKAREEEDEEDMLLQAFSFATGAKQNTVHNTFMSLEEFKRGWLRMADVPKELTKRKLKVDKIALSEGRNRERLNRFVTDQEKAYFANLGKIVGIVEDIKRERRVRKEERKKEAAAFREKLMHEAQKFIAVRNQEKRLQMKLEEEEKNRKRLEEKALRNQLLEKQADAKVAQANAISELRQQSEAVRMAEIKKRGWNRIDLSVQRLRYLPPKLYDNEDARTLLSYAVIIDYSKNVLDHLPESSFMFWMQSVKKLNLSQNRLKKIPDEFCEVRQLEAVELNSNFLKDIPLNIGNLTSLQRLDISNNKITTLPESIGFCGSLKYLSAHSNAIDYLPQSVGAMFRLEYLDLAGNMLTELPEDFQFMASLIYLNLNNNRLAHLPHFFGRCNKLEYLDIANNHILALPDTFSELCALEICAMERNEIQVSQNSFNLLGNLRKFSMHHNRVKALHFDIGACVSVSYLDASVNDISYLSPEIGLMTSLQVFKLNYNSLSTLPPELGSCTDLQKLELMYNQIQGALPDTIGLMESLKSLNFSHNVITEIPRSVIGLKRVDEILGGHCKLTVLPDTFIHLSTLVKLELNNNEFVRFPIELSLLGALRVLDMGNNQIELLPRHINEMTQLESLNLSRNKLRAIPTEFTDILETVATVSLEGNPWNDWPPKWGKLFRNKKCADSVLGYSVPDVLQFLYAMQLFYYEAEKIWETRGSFYYTQRLNMHDFIEDLRTKMPAAKYENLSPEHVKMLFFQAREFGVFPKWYCLDKYTKATIAQRIANDQEVREHNVQRTRRDNDQRKEMTRVAYDVDVRRRANRAQEMADEFHVNEAIIAQASTLTMREVLIKREAVARGKKNYRDEDLYMREVEEMRRLEGIIEDELRIRRKYDYLYSD